VSVRWNPFAELRNGWYGERIYLAGCQRSGSREQRSSRVAPGRRAGRRVSRSRRKANGSTLLRRHEAIRAEVDCRRDSATIAA
jgi:hypothetical protein